MYSLLSTLLCESTVQVSVSLCVPVLRREIVIKTRESFCSAVGHWHNVTKRGSQSAAYLLLAIFDGQLQSGQIVGDLIQERVDIIAIVEDCFQLFRAPRLVQEVLRKLFTHSGEFLVLRLELILHCAQLLQLPAELKRSEERILAGEGDQG